MNTIMIILSIFMLVLTIVTAIFAFWSIKSKAYMPYRKKLADFEEENKKNLVALVHLEIGLQDFEEKNYEKSIEEYTKAIELKPDYAEAYNNRGNLYRVLKMYEQAMHDYVKAIELCERGYGVFRTLNLTVSDQGVVDVAIVEVKGNGIKRKKILLKCIKDSFREMSALSAMSTEADCLMILDQDQNKKFS